MDFNGSVRALARAAGWESAPRGEHDRWRLYVEILECGTSRDALLQVLRMDPDKILVVSLVLRMLELTPFDQHATLLAIVPSDRREYCRRRADEIELLRRVKRGELDLTNPQVQIDDCSDWLQRKLVESTSEPGILDLLWKAGRTKRVRSAARQKLKRRNS